jgi:hypothetical protein
MMSGTRTAADLHQLAARDDHLPAAGDRREHEQHRPSAVVDGDPGLGAEQLRDERPRVIVA